MASNLNHLLWIDLEGTSGNDVAPSDSSILEIGAILTDRELHPIDSYRAVVVPVKAAHVESMIPLVREMHTVNGLLDDLAVGETLTVSDAEDDLVEMLDQYGVEQATLAGSGVEHYDRAMIHHHMPRLYERLTYFSIDIGQTRRFLRDLSGVDIGHNRASNKAHRAVDDIEDHLDEARTVRDTLRRLNNDMSIGAC